MSKQKLFIKHKDDITIKLSKCQSRNFAYAIASNRKECVEAEAINQGWIQALKWVLGFDELFKRNDKDVPVITGDKDTDALLEDERMAQEEL
jgi:hypothetical protein